MSKSLRPDEFEELLRQSLRPLEAPEGFAARVLERAAAAEKRRRWWRLLGQGPRRASWRWFGAAAVLLLAVLTANQVRARRERARAAKIQAQFDTAMRVTSDAIEQTRTELQRVGLRFGE